METISLRWILLITVLAITTVSCKTVAKEEPSSSNKSSVQFKTSDDFSSDMEKFRKKYWPKMKPIPLPVDNSKFATGRDALLLSVMEMHDIYSTLDEQADWGRFDWPVALADANFNQHYQNGCAEIKSMGYNDLDCKIVLRGIYYVHHRQKAKKLEDHFKTIADLNLLIREQKISFLTDAIIAAVYNRNPPPYDIEGKLTRMAEEGGFPSKDLVIFRDFFNDSMAIQETHSGAGYDERDKVVNSLFRKYAGLTE